MKEKEKMIFLKTTVDICRENFINDIQDSLRVFCG